MGPLLSFPPFSVLVCSGLLFPASFIFHSSLLHLLILTALELLLSDTVKCLLFFQCVKCLEERVSSLVVQNLTHADEVAGIVPFVVLR